ncbi:MAG: ABC transporter permease [Fervidobacterium sp.]
MFTTFFLMNFRNKVNFILNVGLPIIFMLLFGAVFGKPSGNINVFYYSDRNISYTNSSWKKLDEEPSLDSLNQLKTLNADVVVIAKNGKIEVYYLSTISQIGPEINLFLGKYMAEVNEEKIFNIEVVPITLKRQLNNLEYIMIGVIAISLLSVGMNAGVSVFSNYVRYGLFKRFTVTPVKPLRLLLSITSAQIFTGIISSVLILLLANLVYKVNLFLNVYYSLLFILVVISAVMISLAVGVVLSLLFKKSAQRSRYYWSSGNQ